MLQDVVAVEGKTVALDGKTICGSGNEQHRAYHVVSAWVTESQITLGQLATEEKSNEITAVPELLDILDVKGSTVTADAMSCQRAIAAQIRQGGADYVLALKGNQPALLEDVKFYFENERVASHKTNDKDHGRIESREYFLETDISWLTQRADWAGLQGIGMVRSTVIQKKTEN